MKRTFILGATAALLFTGNAYAGEREAPVAVNVTNLQPHIAAQVQKHAAEGMTSLARYLERVRKGQQLSVEDVMQPPSDKPQHVAKLSREINRHAKDWHFARES